jgi:hypothetical protein
VILWSNMSADNLVQTKATLMHAIGRVFAAALAPTSYWLTKESIVGILSDFGFKVVIGEDAKEHPNGPAMTLYASRECGEQGVHPRSQPDFP